MKEREDTIDVDKYYSMPIPHGIRQYNEQIKLSGDGGVLFAGFDHMLSNQVVCYGLSGESILFDFNAYRHVRVVDVNFDGSKALIIATNFVATNKIIVLDVESKSIKELPSGEKDFFAGAFFYKDEIYTIKARGTDSNINLSTRSHDDNIVLLPGWGKNDLFDIFNSSGKRISNFNIAQPYSVRPLNAGSFLILSDFDQFNNDFVNVEGASFSKISLDVPFMVYFGPRGVPMQLASGGGK